MIKTLNDPFVRQEGFKEGIKEGKIDVARNLISLGCELHVIMKATNLTEDEINQLLQKCFTCRSVS